MPVKPSGFKAKWLHTAGDHGSRGARIAVTLGNTPFPASLELTETAG
jgi:hypothetical protein